VFSKFIRSHVDQKIAANTGLGNGIVSMSLTSGVFIIHVKTLFFASFTIVPAGICTSILYLFPEDCIITGANIFHILSLVLILSCPTKNPVRLDFILHVPSIYQLAINFLFIIHSDEELGKSIT
jgi:hypothetical protein